jgi:hypothetical protein
LVGSAVLVLVASGCGGGTDPTPVFGAELQPDGVTLHLQLASCNSTEQTAEVVETDAEVRVTVHTKGGTSDDCADGMQVELTDRLGERPLIDDPTDDEIEVDGR